MKEYIELGTQYLIDKISIEDCNKIADDIKIKGKSWYADKHHTFGMNVRNQLRNCEGMTKDSFILDMIWFRIVEQVVRRKLNLE